MEVPALLLKITMLPENELKVLTSLGLTLSQAKVYFTLIMKGPSKVSVIAQTSRIYREHLYVLLKLLEKKGLVEKELSSTTIYSAVPFEQALPTLIDNKQQEISKLEKQVKTLMATYQNKNSQSDCATEKAEISVTTVKKRTLQRVQQQLDNAVYNVDLVNTWDRFVQFTDYYETALEEALSRGVILRHIVESPTDYEQAQKLLLTKNFAHEGYWLRFSKETSGNYIIIDNKRVCTSAKEGKESLGQAPMMVSNYSGFVSVFQSHFDMAWRSAYCWKVAPQFAEIACQINSKPQ